MAATTAFYGSLHALQGAVQIIIDVDTRMTNLKKVMDEDTDFPAIMDNARLSAEKFGKTLNEVLDAYTEFARQGYKSEDLFNLSDAGLITSNVGEMTSAQAAQYLTSAVVQYNIATKDSMKIIDKWNNVSNKNATTVEKLAQGMAKAGSTAYAFGLDMDQLNAIIGTVTAATKQSGNEIGNFVKSALPRLLGQPAQDALKSLNIQFMDKKTGDMRNVVDIYGEVAEKVQNISKVEKMAVMEGLAGKQHISRMTALIDNWGLYKKILEDSRNSEGSAARENEKYMQSLQARIAKMKQSFEELALTMGDSFITEGFVRSLEGLKFVGDSISGLVKTIGGLPLVLATATGAVALLSKGFRTFIVDLTMSIAKGEAFSKALSLIGIESQALKVTLASIGVGAIFIGLSIGLEYFLKKLGEARQKTEELERKNRELVESYKEHRKDVQSLTEEYSKLYNKIKTGVFNTSDIERYKSVTKQLADLMPELVKGEDQYGNKILGSNEAVKSRISLLEKQLEIQEKQDAAKKKQEVEDTYKTAEKNLKSAQENLKNFFSQDYSDPNSKNVRNIDEIIKRLDKLKEKTNLSKSEQNEFKALKDIVDKYNAVKDSAEAANLMYQKATMDMIDNNVKLSDSMGQTSKSMINDFTTFVATSNASKDQIKSTLDNVLNAVNVDPQFQKILHSYAISLNEYQNAINNGADTSKIEEYHNKAKSAYEDVKTVLLDIAKDNKIDPKIINVLSGQLDGLSNSALIASVDLDKFSQAGSKSKEEIMASLLLAPQAEDSYLDMAGATEQSAQADKEKATSIERLIGMTDQQLSSVKDALATYKLLSATEGENANQSQELANAISILASVYPTLVNNKNVNVQAIEKEIYANDVLKQAFEDLANGKLTQEQAMNLVAAQGSKNRIAILQTELQFLQSVVNQYNSIADNLDDQGNSLKKSDLDLLQGEKLAIKASQKIPKVQAQLGIDTSKYNAQIDSLAKSIDFKGFSIPDSKKSSGKKDSGSDKSVEIYQIDKYKQKMDELNNSIEESEFLTKRLDHTSSQYRSELEKQSNVYKEMSEYTLGQIKSLEDRNNALQSQIKSMGDVNKLSNSQKEIFNDLSKELEDNTSEVYQLKDAWRGYQEQMLSMQDDLRESISSQIADEEEARLAILEQELDDVNQQYEDKIDLLQKQLDLLEDTEEVEDRIANLRAKDEEIAKAKSDNRYSYITAQGEEILTYNKEQVSELEKDRDEMVKEYERSDLKKAIQDEIDRLTKAKDDANKTLQKRLDDFKKYWDNLVTQAKNGTLSFSTLMQAWNDNTISSLTNHVNQTGQQLNNIGEMYNSLGNIAKNLDVRTQTINTSLYTAKSTMNSTLSSMTNDLNNATGTLGSVVAGGLNTMLNDANTAKDGISKTLDEVIKKYVLFDQTYQKLMSIKDANSAKYLEAEKLALKQYSQLPKHHEGGTVGSFSTSEGEFANKLFGAKQNEQVAKLLKGEVVINPMLPNVRNNIRNLQNLLINGRNVGNIDQRKTFQLNNVTIKADNPMELFAGLNNLVLSEG